jgi:hypothetical protein
MKIHIKAARINESRLAHVNNAILVQPTKTRFKEQGLDYCDSPRCSDRELNLTLQIPVKRSCLQSSLITLHDQTSKSRTGIQGAPHSPAASAASALDDCPHARPGLAWPPDPYRASRPLPDKVDPPCFQAPCQHNNQWLVVQAHIHYIAGTVATAGPTVATIQKGRAEVLSEASRLPSPAFHRNCSLAALDPPADAQSDMALRTRQKAARPAQKRVQVWEECEWMGQARLSLALSLAWQPAARMMGSAAVAAARHAWVVAHMMLSAP